MANYLKIGKEELFTAAANLNNGALKLWLYLISNANNYKFPLYSSDFIDKCGSSSATYERAFQELVNKGYLIRGKDNTSLYMVVEKPRQADNTNDNDISINELKANNF